MPQLRLPLLLILLAVGTTRQQQQQFTCPEEFGYFPHPQDCSQYYVCVFGGALLESCTGGLMYSHDLQTCDWPRNVYCNGTAEPKPLVAVSPSALPPPQNKINSIQPRFPDRRPSISSTAAPISPVLSYKPIEVETYGKVTDLAGQSRFQDDNNADSSRLGRSYEGNIPDYKQEIRGRSVSSHPKTKRPQEIIVDNNEYLAQRYAAGINTSTAYQYNSNNQQAYPQSAQTPQTQNYEDESYYIYDDAGEEPQYDDVDYKTPYLAPSTTTTTTTPRPQRIRQQPPKQQYQTFQQQTPKQHSSSRPTSTRQKSSSRPTLKPKHSIVKDSNQQVRDVYVDSPTRPRPVYETPAVNSPSTKCRKDLCVLPDCSCGGKEIPGNLRPEETPQIVLLTFDDSVNDLNKNLYRDLFEKGRKNSNGCPISATFYVSHEWTDYSQVQNLAADGHEIASHSVSHSFGEQFSQKKWDKEIGGQREILAAYGGVKLSDVRGMRAPFLAIGGNHMFKMLHDSNFTYDSSMPVYENRPPSWPYTIDYRIFHDCMIPPCPTKSYPGVWEVPMVMWTDLKGGRCSMGDACSNPPNAEGVYQMLAKNFERHYTTNRAPFGLYYHAAWFTTPHHKEGFEAFLDSLVQMDDVWLVTNWQALQWVRNPTPLNRIHNFQPWSCHNQERPERCNHPKVCNLWHKSGVRYMKTCQTCPQQYPWTGNTGVPFTNSL